MCVNVEEFEDEYIQSKCIFKKRESESVVGGILSLEI